MVCQGRRPRFATIEPDAPAPATNIRFDAFSAARDPGPKPDDARPAGPLHADRRRHSPYPGAAARSRARPGSVSSRRPANSSAAPISARRAGSGTSSRHRTRIRSVASATSIVTAFPICRPGTASAQPVATATLLPRGAAFRAITNAGSAPCWHSATRTTIEPRHWRCDLHTRAAYAFETVHAAERDCQEDPSRSCRKCERPDDHGRSHGCRPCRQRRENHVRPAGRPQRPSVRRAL